MPAIGSSRGGDSCQDRRFSNGCEWLWTTSEALIYATMGRLTLSRLAEIEFADSLWSRSATRAGNARACCGVHGSR